MNMPCWFTAKGAMILKSLDDYIEALYSNWYLAELSRNWNEVLEAENRMQAWQIPGVPRQQNFFNEVVKPQFQNPQIKTRVRDNFRCPAL
mgnify:CR=1 FL=1